MDDPIGAVSLISELFSWIGLGAGAVMLVIGLLRGAYFRGWSETLGVVVVNANGDLAYRWLGEDGLLYEAPSIDDDSQVLEPGDDVTVYVSPRDPAVGRIDDPRHEGRALRTTGWILLALGAAAVVLQFVLLFG
ncbi:DUF3592 domain-containing protein [Herbiconiux daphne]|uniref:DUF3592 domain-containing protein n=1 Tax=Herbiconiux daphne TaxID=2970914 RepID=A0ABT2H043_9MICO|nr:DUF3592 domain-containing protein [Herbiconiux daphne]MCS5732940.1 DUF3592 domain-containing protein [Herbiconiux daphne]